MCDVTAAAAQWSEGDVVTATLDLTAGGTIAFYLNGVSLGTAFRWRPLAVVPSSL